MMDMTDRNRPARCVLRDPIELADAGSEGSSLERR